MRKLLLAILFSSTLIGKMPNPITDVCWKCLFPMTVSGINLTPGTEDFSKNYTPMCACKDLPPIIGLPFSYWEPLRLVDVTTHAYKLVCLGGISIGNENVKNRGSIGLVDEHSSKTSFYHVHFFEYPVLALLGLFTDFSCITSGSFDTVYMSEFDPLWSNDQVNAILNPEAALFANPLAQTACIADCLEASVSHPDDNLFWCAGCEGSLYPFTGTVAHHVGGIQASSLLLHRALARLHRIGFMMGYEKTNFCKTSFMPIIKKSLYKTQLVHPVPQTSGPCHPLGESDLLWGAGKSFPKEGEEFVYLIWVKKQCCLDCVKPAAALFGIPLP